MAIQTIPTQGLSQVGLAPLTSQALPLALFSPSEPPLNAFVDQPTPAQSLSALLGGRSVFRPSANELEVHPNLEGFPDRTIFPLPSPYAEKFTGNKKGSCRILHENLGTVLSVKNVTLTSRAGFTILSTGFIKDPGPFAKKPEDVDIVLVGLHGATHPEKSNGASLLIPMGFVEQKAKEKGIHVVSVIPDLPLHGLGPTDPRFDNLDFYLEWLRHIFEEIHATYPKARIILYGRSAGADTVLALAYDEDLDFKGLRIKGIFADSPGPPGTSDLQTLAILEREARSKAANPDHPDYQPVPGSAERLRGYESQWTFWNQRRPPKIEPVVRFGERDDNAAKYSQKGWWKPWSQRTGVPLKIDDGEHDGLGGIQKHEDSKASAIALSNVDAIIDMMEKALKNSLRWRSLDKIRKEEEERQARASLEGYKTALTNFKGRLEKKKKVPDKTGVEVLQTKIAQAETDLSKAQEKLKDSRIALANASQALEDLRAKRKAKRKAKAGRQSETPPSSDAVPA